MATVIVRPGGNVANIGVHGKSVTIWLSTSSGSRTSTFRWGWSTPTPSGCSCHFVAEHKLPADEFVTHEFSFDQMIEAYDVFGHAADHHNALKVLIH